MVEWWLPKLSEVTFKGSSLQCGSSGLKWKSNVEVVCVGAVKPMQGKFTGHSLLLLNLAEFAFACLLSMVQSVNGAANVVIG